MPNNPATPETLAFLAAVERALHEPDAIRLGRSRESRRQTPLRRRTLHPWPRANRRRNIAGAASLAATADTSAQKQAIREGAAHFS